MMLAHAIRRASFAGPFAASALSWPTAVFPAPLSARLFSSSADGTVTPPTSAAGGAAETTDWSKMKIYTRTGDKGTAQLFTGERRPKSDPTFEALGAVDELNSLVGVAREHAVADGCHGGLAFELECIMSRLFDVGAAVATPKDTKAGREGSAKAARAAFDAAGHTAELEGWIDQRTEPLPPLTNFVLPSGGITSASLHVARAVCRRAERSVHVLALSGSLDPEVAAYMNRLSDYLFTAARSASHAKGCPEVIWRKAAPAK